jgi:hypothetical protein
MEQTAFSRLLTAIFNLSSTETVFRFVLDLLQANVATHGKPTEVHTLSYYDPDAGISAVSNGGAGVCVREGRTDWKQIKNGDNGILFINDLDADPWDPEFAGAAGTLEWFIDLIQFADDPLCEEFAQTALRVWLLQQFFPPFRRTRVIPTFLGPQGSGKSTACRSIGRSLVGSAFDVSGLRREKEDAFIAAVANRVVHAVDNADSRVDWLEDDLARYATGEKYRMRKLYTTNEEVSYSPRAILLLSSRDPHFQRADVSERLLPFHLKRLERFADEHTIYKNLMARRGRLIADILTQVGSAADALQSESLETFTPSFRMADYALFGWRIVGDKAKWLQVVQELEKAQIGFAAEGDSLIIGLGALPEDSPKIGPISVKELYDSLQKVAEDQGFTLPKTIEGFR